MGPFPILGVPVNIIIELHTSIGMDVDYGLCARNQQNPTTHIIVRPDIFAALRASASITVGLSFISVGIRCDSALVDVHLQHQIIFEMESRKVAVMFRPYTTSPSMDIEAVALTRSITIAKYKGYRKYLTSKCIQSDGAAICPADVPELPAPEPIQRPLRPASTRTCYPCKISKPNSLVNLCELSHVSRKMDGIGLVLSK